MLNGNTSHASVKSRPDPQDVAGVHQNPKPITLQHVETEDVKDDSGEVIGRVSGYRDSGAVYVHVDVYDPRLLDNNNVKMQAWNYRMVVGMGNAGLEPVSGGYALNASDKPPSLLPIDEAHPQVYRRLFKLNNPI
jgi:hypothetical protein